MMHKLAVYPTGAVASGYNMRKIPKVVKLIQTQSAMPASLTVLGNDSAARLKAAGPRVKE